MFDVITVGSATRDVFIKSKAFKVIDDPASDRGRVECLELGSKVEIEEIAFASGGGGTNAAVTFARQGYNAACVGIVGTDSAGEEVIGDLRHEGVNTDFMARHSDGYTAYSVVLVHASGERTIMTYKGEGQHFNVDQIPFTSLQSRWLYLDSLGGHFDLFERLIQQAIAGGAKIACNPGGRELGHGLDKLRPLLEHIDIYITNTEEGALLVNTKPADALSTLTALRQVLPKAIIALTAGREGSLVMSQDGTIYSAGVPDSPVVDATGAGDAFGSGFVSEYMRTGDIIKAIQLGTANGSSVVAHYGAKAGILRKGDSGLWAPVEVKISK